jgi:lambda family phage portal protein
MMAIEALDLKEIRHDLAAQNAKRSGTSESTLAQLGGGGSNMGFAAAKYSRLTGDWPSAMRSADQELVVDLRRLRSRARFQAMNSPTATKFLQMVRSNVVGKKGINLAFKVAAARATKNNGGLDDKVNAELKKKWQRWGKKGSCTVCGRYSWREVQNIMVEAMARDGEALIRKVYVSRDVNPFGFQLQLIDADQLDDTYNILGRADGTQVRMGVEVDANQKPLAYYLFSGNPSEVSQASAKRIRVPADQIIHLFVAHRIGQTRGYPWFAASMGQLNMLDGYFNAELAAARISSKLIMSIQSTAPGADTEYSGADGINADGSKAIDLNGDGIALEMDPGQVLNNQTPQHPTAAFENFVKQSGRVVASGMNVAYHKLCNDLAGINYSSGRLGELEEREYWMESQTHFIENGGEPVYEAWLRASLLNRALDVPFDVDRYTDDAVKWEPRRWPWVDPLKDVQANTLLVQNGFETNTAILESMGLDLEEVYETRKREIELADQLGLAFGTDIRGQMTSEVNSEENDAADGSEKPDKPAKPKAATKPAPPKPKVKQLARGVHPANAPLFDVSSED